MIIYYSTTNEHRLREMNEVAREFSGALNIEVHNDDSRKKDSHFQIKEYSYLTVEGNQYYSDAITDENDTPKLVNDILAFWSQKTQNEERMCKLHTILFIGKADLNMVEDASKFQEYEECFEGYLLEQFMDAQYGGKNLSGLDIGYDLDTVLYAKKYNRTFSTMTYEQRNALSPRKRAFRKLIRAMFLEE